MVIRQGNVHILYFQDECSPLHLAAVVGHLEVTKCLVSSGADISCKDNVCYV